MNPGLNRRSVFGLSLLDTAVFSVAIIVLIKRWYPDFYSNLYEVNLKLAAFLSLIFLLGPVINVLIYKPQRDKYVNDLSVLYILKLVVLGVGLHLAYTQRPVLVAFSVDRLVVVQAHQTEMGRIPPEIMKLMISSEAPPLIAARELPKDDLSLIFEVMSGGVDIEYRPAHYERFKHQRERFYHRMCNSEIDVKDFGVNFDRNCGSIAVPLVYDTDEFAIAVFDSEHETIRRVIFQDPW
ncbi:hypothetical protein [Marinobacter sp. SS13-12]|uniref:hypothetical protein n=1 Tax=Marinobacter sp. SS13-12 TaxID=3050451 RepID=UPI00255249B2|nr:hypothetical protein [Marinobacter sp. SS13-12]MDK8463822.1 hypothetical protein [Marinobacter sp. SS13-12]